MKRVYFVRVIIVVLVLLVIAIYYSMLGTKIDASKIDESDILYYLEVKTDDIAPANPGIRYVAYKTLDIINDRIYLWVVKEDFIQEQNGQILTETVVACPVVLIIGENENGLFVKSHNYPEDGKDYGYNLKRYFPEKVRGEINALSPEDTLNLKNEIIDRIRVGN